MNTPIQDDVSSADPSMDETSRSAEAQIGGSGSIANGTLEEYFQTLGGFHSLGGGVQIRGEGGGRTQGGFKEEERNSEDEGVDEVDLVEAGEVVGEEEGTRKMKKQQQQ
ncbi:hypothetical protein AgCh_015722 [Apium graveolens]